MYADIKKYPNLGFLNKNLWKIFLGIKLWIFFFFFCHKSSRWKNRYMNSKIISKDARCNSSPKNDSHWTVSNLLHKMWNEDTPFPMESIETRDGIIKWYLVKTS